MAGGGSGGGSTNTVQNTNAYIPQWLSDYGQAAVQSAAQLSSQPYAPYTGQTVAGFDPYQTQAYNQIGQMQGLGSGAYGQDVSTYQNMLGQAQPLTAGGVLNQSQPLYGNYLGQVYNQQANLLGNYMGSGGAQQIGMNAQALMSPYINSVIGPSMQLGQQALTQNLQQVGANANQAGAFGGSRQGVMEGVAQSQAALGESNLMGQMLNQGWNSALYPAMTAEGQGYSAANTLANSLQSGYGGAATQGYNMGALNQSAGLTAAQNLPGALTSYQQQALGQANALNAAGQQQQQYQQNLLNAGYGQYMQQQAWPYQQLQTFLGAIGGIPYSVSNTSDTSTAMPSNLLGQAIGGVSALGGLAGGVGSILGGNQSATGR